jgi:hypothetical protein
VAVIPFYPKKKTKFVEMKKVVVYLLGSILPEFGEYGGT